MRKYDAFMYLSFDVTRKCNMQCDYCLKGDSENKTITREVVDKTFDELQNCVLHSVRLYGGEPFLASDMVVYILDQIIARKITVGHIGMNTNGMIKNPEIRDALKRITQYITGIKNGCNLFPAVNALDASNVSVTVSTIRHANTNDEVNNCIEYYNEIGVSGFVCKRDSGNTNAKVTYALTGNMLKNHSRILDNPINWNQVYIPENKYDFIREYNYSEYSAKNEFADILIDKTISISTNGEVYVGCTVAWDDVDNKTIFNIMDCNGDFLDKIDQYCWEYPVNEKIRDLRCNYRELLWCRSNGYLVENTNERTYGAMEKMIHVSYLHEEAAKKIHEEYPYFNHTEVNDVTSAHTAMELLKEGYDVDFVRAYMNSCTNFENLMKNTCDSTNLNNYAQFIIREAIKRRDQKSDDHANIVNIFKEQEELRQMTPEKLGSALGLLLGLALFAGKKK